MGNENFKLDLIIPFIAPEPDDLLILIGDNITNLHKRKLKQLFNLKTITLKISELYNGKITKSTKKYKSIIYYIDETFSNNIINLLQTEANDELQELLNTKTIFYMYTNEYNKVFKLNYHRLILNTSKLDKHDIIKLTQYLDQNSNYFNYLIQEEFIAIITE